MGISATHPAAAAEHTAYVRHPGRFTRRILNPMVAFLARRGFGLFGAHVLAVRGRRSGEWRRTPVNPLEFDGARYLIAARGHVQWTKNMRAAGGGELILGRRREPFLATEVPDAEKPEILRTYLRKWAFEVGAFFDGEGADSSDEALARIAPDHPLFLIRAATDPRIP